MEPFGLFQFLQNLLSNPPSNEGEKPNQEPTTEKEKSEPITGFEPQKTAQQEAALQFFAMHDERAKRLKPHR